jgi:hypothetical protein
MLPNTMLKKRLRVFAKISNENEEEVEESIPKFKREFYHDNQSKFDSVNSDFGFCLGDCLSNTNDDTSDKKTVDITDNFKDYEPSLGETNTITLNFPSGLKVTEDNLFSMIHFYGEIESSKIIAKDNIQE